MSKETPEKCTRYRVVVDDFHFYFMLGDDFVQVVPNKENRPENIRERKVLDAFCNALTKVMGGSND